MPRMIAALAPSSRQVTREAKRWCTVCARAQIVSLGGAVLLALCLLGTAGLLVALAHPMVTALQRGITGIIGISFWVYLIQSATEELVLWGNGVVLRARFRRSRRFAFADIRSLAVYDRGLNSERGVFTLEVHVFGKEVERVSLGPCWSARSLEGFVVSTQEKMRGIVREGDG